MLDNYREILRAAQQRLGDHALVDELTGAVDDFARAVGEAGGTGQEIDSCLSSRYTDL
jgi:hypothetical protein